jgi:hypothetical protein
MSVRTRSNWSRHIDQVIRSQHYTWLGEGLGGAPPEEALVDIATDMRHICERQGISWEALLEKSRKQFEQEEFQSSRQRAG